MLDGADVGNGDVSLGHAGSNELQAVALRQVDVPLFIRGMR